MLELTGFLGLTRISFFLLTQIPQIPLYCFVGGKSHRWLCGCGLLGAARGSLSRTYLLDPSDKSDLSDKSDGLDIFKNNPSGICVRPPWDWDLCEASVDSVWAGDKITKNCVIWGAF